ncbi:VIR protein [Plasmodium vivax]|uniref:VIR protein n=1 Tax=Plasmodium vivax TaxID=5855 RepID=A0A1G4E7A2_PLAVI|nr:VIR protein [Plasmodium vivax]
MNQVLSSLPSTINYNKLNKNYGEYHNEVQCDKLHEELKKVYPEKLGDYKNIQKFCEKLTDILSRFNTLKFYGSLQDHKCIIVKYWMYDQLFNYIKGEYSIENMRPFLHILPSIWKGSITDTNCILDDVDIDSKEDFNKIKILFDYAQDYNTIKSAIKLPNKECSDEYMSYLKKGIETYNAFKQDCSDNSDEHYCVKFRNLKNIYEMDKLSNIICKIENPSLKYSLEAFNFPDEDDSEREERETKGLGKGKQQMEYFEEEEEVNKGGIGIAGNGLQDSGRMLQLDRSVQLEPGVPLDSQALSHSLSPSPLSTNDNLRKAVIPVSGGLLSLFMFYKFTPLGRRLRVFFSRNKLNSLNNNQVNDYLLTNKIEYGHPNSEIDRHNIGYNPL